MKYTKSVLYVFIVSIIFMLMFLPCPSNADPLDNWNLRTSGTTKALYGVTSGNWNGIFVAVGDAGIILTSPNGVTWTKQTSVTDNAGTPLDLSGVALYGVTTGGSKFVAVGGAGTILTSFDGVTWTKQGSGGTVNTIAEVIYGNGIFVALPALGTTLTSTNGVDWFPSTSTSTASTDWPIHISYVNNTFVGITSFQQIVTSSDGINWAPQGFLQWQDNSGNYPPTYGREVAYGSNTYVVVGGYLSKPGLSPDYNLIMTSPDLVTWTQEYCGALLCPAGPGIPGIPGILHGVTYGNCTFVAVGSDNVGDESHILTSPNGVSWTNRYSALLLAGLNKVTYGNNTFVAVGGNGTILQSDPVSQAFDFTCDNQGWTATGLFDDLGLAPIPGWFIFTRAPWSNFDGYPTKGAIFLGVGSFVQLPASPTNSLELHADFISPDLSGYTQWQGISSFSYSVTGSWIWTSNSIKTGAVLWVKNPDGSMIPYSDFQLYDIPFWPSGSWATHTVNVKALGIPANSLISYIVIGTIFQPSSGVYGIVEIDNVVSSP